MDIIPVFNKEKIFLVLLSSVLALFSFPDYDFYWFGFISLAPLIYAVRDDERPFLTGFSWGIVTYSGMIYWVSYAINVYGRVNIVLAFFGNLLLVCYLSVYSGLFALFVRDSSKYLKISPLISAPLVWTSLELIRTFMFTGFPWALFGSSQYKNIRFIQFANITGVYGVSFILVLFNAMLADALFALKKKENIPLLKVGISAALIAAVFIYGSYSMEEGSSHRKIKVALIQANIEQDKKWNPSFQDETMKKYINLTLSGEASGSKLIVWPETALPFFYQFEPGYQKLIKEVSTKGKADILFGSPAVKVVDSKNMNYFNRAYFLSNKGNSVASYDKMHLVPFGEYVPSFIPFLTKLVYGIGEFIPGTDYTVFKSESGNFSVLICFEGIFPQQSREFVKNGANFLVNITNDAWYGRSSAPFQHLSLSVFRAVENSVPLIRAANTGVSAIIDSKGRIAASSDIFMPAVVSGEIKSEKGKRTFYTEYGDIFSVTCLAFSVIMLSLIIVRRRRNAGKNR